MYRQTLLLLLLTTTRLLAHPGHPGPETHGPLTHLMLGLTLALPAVLGLLLWHRKRSLAAQPVKTSRETDRLRG